MSRSIVVFLTVVAVQICIGKKACDIWSSVGDVIPLGSSFQVYCVFKEKCHFHMNDPSEPNQQPSRFDNNSTTLYYNVTNIAKNTTYSCDCTDRPALDSCGLDILTGNPPAQPQSISCNYKITLNQSGDLHCTWESGPNNLKTSSVLWVKTLAGSNSAGPASERASKGNFKLLSATATVPTSVQRMSVWVQAQNILGGVNSSVINYNLSDIAMPSTPVLGQPKCHSRKCVIRVEQPMKTEHLEIQYKADQETWETHQPNSEMQMKSSLVWTINSLEPFRFYHFRARAKFRTGLWSHWSVNTSSWTEEEAPAKELDVWFTESDVQSMKVYWKEANISISRGTIIEYRIGVQPKSNNASLSADLRNYSISHCINCEVTIWARNSKGLSPPAKIMTRRLTGNPPQDVRVKQNNNSITIYWRAAETAPLPTGYVVEWYPQGHKLEELRWVRLSRNNNHFLISDMKPSECYQGAVYGLHNDNSDRGTRFDAVAIAESVPKSSPVIQEKIDGNKVTVTWGELPRSQRGGCITNYTVYLVNDRGNLKEFSAPASKRTHIIDGLSPGEYNLWMSASTAKGEGPKSEKVRFDIQQETPLFSLVGCIFASVVVVALLCSYQNSAVKRRFWEFFQCIMLDVVPDPANSKWAKECSQEKGQLNLHLQLSTSTEAEEEEEPILVDVEELAKQSDDTSAPKINSIHLHHEGGLSHNTELTTPLYPQTTYIKSFSHDSDSSDLTHTSMDTNTTVDYISSHGPGNLDEDEDDDEEEEEEGEFANMNFFPSHNIFMQSLDFGGKLTLDSVKINCSNFFQNCDV
ncbi:unnamed protein product [Ophioblennius macclurei]